MPIPFLSSIGLNKNEVQDFKVFNLASDPTLTSGGDFGYFWLNTSGTKTLKFWDGANIRSLIDSTTISSSTAGLATDLAGGGAGQVVYQNGSNDTQFLAAGTAGQVLSSNGSSAPSWLDQASLSVGSATNKTGGNLGDLLVQSGSGSTGFLNVGTAGQVITSNGASPQYVSQSTLSVGSATTATTSTSLAGGANGSIAVQSGVGATGFLSIGANGYILTSNGTTPGWSATIPSSSVSGLAASATTDTTNASNITSGTLGLGRLSLATGQFYVGDASSNPAATAKSSIPLSGFGNAAADLNLGGFKITNSGTIGSGDSDSTVATKGYVDAVAQGLDVKASCLVASTTDITLSAPGAITIDGVVASTDFTTGVTRILVKDQSAQAENGIYIWQGPAAAMTRSADANTWDELVAAFTFIERGTANADSGWVCNVNAGGTLGTTAVTWTKFSQAGSYTAGNGMVLSGGAFSFAQSSAYTAGQIPFASSTSAIGFSSNLHWDNSNNRLGIGTATPSKRAELQVAPAASASDGLRITDSTRVLEYGITGSTFSYRGASANEAWVYGNANLNLVADGASIKFSSGSSSTRLTLDTNGYLYTAANGRIGVGVVPLFDLHVERSGQAELRLKNTSGSGLAAISLIGGSQTNPWYIYTDASRNFIFQDSSTERLRIDSAGNIGIGTSSPVARLQVEIQGASILSSVLAKMGGGDNDFKLVARNGSGAAVPNAESARFGLEWQPLSASGTFNSGIRFFRGGGGTDGYMIFATSGVDRMTLDASGNLLVGAASAKNAASGRGNVTIEGTSSAILNLSVNNSDTGYLFHDGTNIALDNKANGYVRFSSNNAERLRIKSTGQLNFTGLAADPTGAAGDLYYYSTGNYFKWHNGTAWQTFPRKYSTALSSTGTSFTVTHNLGTRDVTVMVRKSGSTYDQVFTDVQMTDTNNVTVIFASSVTGSDYTVTVIG